MGVTLTGKPQRSHQVEVETANQLTRGPVRLQTLKYFENRRNAEKQTYTSNTYTIHKQFDTKIGYPN